MRPWMISEDFHRRFLEATGQKEPAFAPEPSERSFEPCELLKPARDRKPVKTLLANAGAARMLFWILSRG